MALSSSIPQALSLAVVLHIGGMALSVAFEIAGVLLKPEFDPRVVAMATIRMLLSPSGAVLSVQRPLAGTRPTALLPLAHPRIGCKALSTIRTPLPSHLGLPSALE